MKRKLDHKASVRFAAERLKELHIKRDAIFRSSGSVPFFSIANLEAMTFEELRQTAIEIGFFHEINSSIAHVLEDGLTLPDSALQWTVKLLRGELDVPTNPDGRPKSDANLDVVIKMIVDDLWRFSVPVYGANEPKTDQSKGAHHAISEATESLTGKMDILTREQVKGRYRKHLKWLRK